MKAVVQTKRGKNFSTMQVKDIASPSPSADQLKVKIAASRINPVDMDLMKGFPSLTYQNPQIGGIDGAGTVIEVGKDAKDFTIGDQVFFYRKFSDIGTWAQEIIIPAKDVAIIPKGSNLNEAGSIALPALTAYEALISLNAKQDETVLIHGAGGGVGFMAVQLAQHLGLEVIANVGTRDIEKLEQVGVKHIIDYKKASFMDLPIAKRPDYIFDVLGGKTLIQSIKLKPKKVVSVAYADTSKMHKTGVALPGFLKWMMKLMMIKFTKAARKANVELIGQVTGPNGKLMAEAAELFDQKGLIISEPRFKSIDEIEKGGLSQKDLGKVILFA